MALSTKYEKLSFGGGELSPHLYARGDLARHQVAFRYSENMVVLVAGGATRRPGTRFMFEAKAHDEDGLLVPFTRKRNQSLILDFSAGVGRVYVGQGVVETSPGVPYEFAIPFSEAELDGLRWAQSVDAQFYATGSKPKRLQRFADDNFVFDDYAPENGPVLAQNLDKAKTIQASAVTGSITLTANFPAFEAGHVGSVWRLDEATLANIGYWSANETVATVAPGTTSYASANLRRFRNNVYAAVGPGAFASSVSSGPNSPTHEEGDWSSGSNYVTWRFLYKGYGYVRIDTFVNATTVTATVIKRLPDSIVSQPGFRWSEAAWSDVQGWPTNVFLHEQRLIWCFEDMFYITRPGSYYDFETDATDGSAIIGRLNASPGGAYQEIQWILSSGVFVIGTEDTEWIARAPGAYDAVTATNMRVLPDEGEGSVQHRPCYVRGGAMFIGSNRKRLHYAKIDRLAEALDIQDATTFADHILRARALELAWQRNPNNILWVRMSDGTLRALTFEPKQQALSWHRHSLHGGFVERVACKPDSEGEDDEVWFRVRRTVLGETRRYIEKMERFFWPVNDEAPTAAGAWFVDCGIEYTGSAATHFSGATHLAGLECVVVADGAMRAPLIVGEDGAFDLEAGREASHVIIGVRLPYSLRTLPIETQTRNGTSRGQKKHAKRAYINLVNAAGNASVRTGLESPSPIFEGLPANAGPLPLFTGGKQVGVISAHVDELDFTIQGSDAMPFTLTGVSVKADVQEDF